MGKFIACVVSIVEKNGRIGSEALEKALMGRKMFRAKKALIGLAIRCAVGAGFIVRTIDNAYESVGYNPEAIEWID